MRDRRGIQDQAIQNSPSAPPDKSGEREKEALPVDDDAYSSAPAIFGVITYIINDARNAEFDDCPVM
jgi:hypothetical protein